jgi:hypothetical protein
MWHDVGKITRQEGTSDHVEIIWQITVAEHGIRSWHQIMAADRHAHGRRSQKKTGSRSHGKLSGKSVTNMQIYCVLVKNQRRIIMLRNMCVRSHAIITRPDQQADHVRDYVADHDGIPQR